MTVELRPLHLGRLSIPVPLFMAPMAGITDRVFRLIARSAGAGVVCTEMISARGIVNDDAKTRSLMSTDPQEHPISVQLFGSTPADLAEAAKYAVAAGADIVDINLGCPARKIVKNGSGSRAGGNERSVAAIIEQVVGAVSVPVSVKIRIGPTADQITSPRIAVVARESGAALIVVHARSVDRVHAGEPDLEALARTVESAGIPVIGNGGIHDELSAADFLNKTGCAGLMVGRGAIGDPGLFSRIRSYCNEGVITPGPDINTRFEALLRHADLAVRMYTEKRAFILLRKVIPYYLRGIPGASGMRRMIPEIVCMSDLERMISSSRHE